MSKDNPLSELRRIITQWGRTVPPGLIEHLQFWADRYVHCFETSYDFDPYRDISGEEEHLARDNMRRMIGNTLSEIAEVEVNRERLVNSRTTRVWLLYDRGVED